MKENQYPKGEDSARIVRRKGPRVDASVVTIFWTLINYFG